MKARILLISAVLLSVMVVGGCNLMGEDPSDDPAGSPTDNPDSLSIPVSVSANVGAGATAGSTVGASLYDLSPVVSSEYYKTGLQALGEAERIATLTPDEFLLQMDFLTLYHRPESAQSGMDFVTDDLRSQFSDDAGAIIPQMVNMRYADRFIRGVTATRETYDGIAMQFLTGIGETNGMPTTSYFAVDISGIEGATCSSFLDPVTGDPLFEYSSQLSNDFGIPENADVCYFSFDQLQPFAVDFLSYVIIGSDIEALSLQNPEGEMPTTGDPPSWQFPGGGTSGNASQLFVPTAEPISFQGLSNPEVIFNWETEDLIEIYKVTTEGEEDKFYITLKLDNPFPISLTVREQTEGDGTGTAGAPDEVLRPYIGVAEASEFGTSIHNTIYWVNPPDPAFDRVVIVRKIDSPPSDAEDGEIVHDSHRPAFVDATGVEGTHYYYRIYTVSHSGDYSEGIVMDRVQGPR